MMGVNSTRSVRRPGESKPAENKKTAVTFVPRLLVMPWFLRYCRVASAVLVPMLP